MKRALLVFLFAVLALGVPRSARAHGTQTAYVEITIVSQTDATISMPEGTGLIVEVGGDCALLRAGAPVMQLHCAGGVAGAVVRMSGFGGGALAAVVRVHDAEGGAQSTVLTAASPQTQMPGRGSARAVVSRFALLGMEHVLGGADHLLLLLALFWGAHERASRRGGKLRHAAAELARTATTFTLAHSVSLAATALGWVRIASAPAEAAIALSLVLVALDVGVPAATQGAQRQPPGPRLGLIGAFGLVHGLGFAGGLASVGLPEDSVPVALLAFNVGVEIAQAIALGSCLVLAIGVRMALATMPDRSDRLLRLASTLSSYAIGVTGAALFFVRTSAFLLR